jgi:protein-tyrosine phosphatase
MERICGGDPQGKLRKLLSRDVADPWYTGNFEDTYADVTEGCTALLEELRTEIYQIGK